jgi:hypothetical protein
VTALFFYLLLDCFSSSFFLSFFFRLLSFSLSLSLSSQPEQPPMPSAAEEKIRYYCKTDLGATLSL